MRHHLDPERVRSGCRILSTHTVLFRPRHPLIVGDGAVRRHVSVRTPNGRAPRGTATGMSGGRTATALSARARVRAQAGMSGTPMLRLAMSDRQSESLALLMGRI